MPHRLPCPTPHLLSPCSGGPHLHLCRSVHRLPCPAPVLPLQWGSPIFTSAGVFTMFAAVIPAALESIGDYYAAARLGGVPQPHTEVVSRALAVESVCCVVSGLLGTTSGSTAYAGGL